MFGRLAPVLSGMGHFGSLAAAIQGASPLMSRNPDLLVLSTYFV
jgi:hypothetical protein